MKYTKDKQDGKQTARVIGLAAAVILLAGCGSSGAQERTKSVAESEETAVISLNLAERSQPIVQEEVNAESKQEDSTSANKIPANGESRPVNPVQQETGGGRPDSSASENTAPKKQPPEGFELVLNSEDWGLSFGEPGTQPIGNASPEDLAWYDAYFMDDDSEKVIYLTFDCGYENGNTEPILDALKKHNVKATFFVVGHFLETAPDLVKRMVEEGHAVGNHTYHHPDMSSISELDAFQKELDDVAGLFYKITGTELSPYYRPPQGKANAGNIRMAQQLGYYTIFWSLAYVDWDTGNQPSHDAAFDKLTSRIHPGAIVLLHNTSQTNGEILDELLTKWEDMGYTFRSLSVLTSARRMCR